MQRAIALVFFIGTSLHAQANASFELRGYLATEYRSFIHEPVEMEQQSSHVTFSLQPELYYAWSDSRFSLTFTPFARLGGRDEEREHTDIRNLFFQTVSDHWELRVGQYQVFWGVTESQHLVDIINQTDLVEDPEGEVKLGQPMVNLTLPNQWGITDIFILPYFRERTFPGKEGRLRGFPAVDTGNAQFESDDKERHIDYALRWSNSVDIWDIGLSYFNGTSRAPSLQMDVTDSTSLVPFYYQLTQLGLDLQATIDVWLLKFESVYREQKKSSYSAYTAGFEYSLFGVLESDHDLGLLVEYLYDSRGDDAETPFENDIMLGVRWLANDVQGTEALLGLIVDPDTEAKLYNLEASRRLTDHWKLNLIGRFYSDVKKDKLLAHFEQEDYWQIDIRYFF